MANSRVCNEGIALREGPDWPLCPGSCQAFRSIVRVRVGTGQRESVGTGTQPESRVGLGCLEEFVDAGRGSWWRAGGQPQVGENLDDDRGIFNGRHERQSTAALRTGGEVDGEDAFE